MVSGKREKSRFNWSGGKIPRWRCTRRNRAKPTNRIAADDREPRQRALVDARHPLSDCSSAGRQHRPAALHDRPSRRTAMMENYEEAMAAAVGHFRDTGADRFIFGDIFLHDVRSYRESNCRPTASRSSNRCGANLPRKSCGNFSPRPANRDRHDDRRPARPRLHRAANRRNVRTGTCPTASTYAAKKRRVPHILLRRRACSARPQFALGEPLQRRYPVKLDDGTVKNYAYWFADIRKADPPARTYPYRSPRRQQYLPPALL